MRRSYFEVADEPTLNRLERTLSDRLKSRKPSRRDVAPGDSPTLSGLPAESIERPQVAASIHPSSATATNPNRAKRHGARLPSKVRTSVKRDGLTRSGVTVIRVDPSTLRRSTAGGRNTSAKVIDGGQVIARNLLSRRAVRKVAV